MTPQEINQYSPHFYLQQLLQQYPVTPDDIEFITKIDRQLLKELYYGIAAFTPDLSIRLGLFFGIAPDTFAKLQASFDCLEEYHLGRIAEYYPGMGSKNTPGWKLAKAYDDIVDDEELPF